MHNKYLLVPQVNIDSVGERGHIWLKQLQKFRDQEYPLGNLKAKSAELLGLFKPYPLFIKATTTQQQK